MASITIITCLHRFQIQLLLVYKTCVVLDCLDILEQPRQDNPTLKYRWATADRHGDINHINEGHIPRN